MPDAAMVRYAISHHATRNQVMVCLERSKINRKVVPLWSFNESLFVKKRLIIAPVQARKEFKKVLCALNLKHSSSVETLVNGFI